VVINIKGTQVVPPGTFDYKFKLKIKGFEKGTYHVILKTTTEQILDQEFTL